MRVEELDSEEERDVVRNGYLANGYDESDGEEYDMNGYTDPTVEYAVQLAMRDDDEFIVERALDKIRHAQRSGRAGVKLSRRELDALERSRQNDMGSRAGSRRVSPTASPYQRRSSDAYSSARPPPGQARSRAPSIHSQRPHTPQYPPYAALNYGMEPPIRPPSSASTRIQPAYPNDPYAPRSRSSSNAYPYPPYMPTSYVPVPYEPHAIPPHPPPFDNPYPQPMYMPPPPPPEAYAVNQTPPVPSSPKSRKSTRPNSSDSSDNTPSSGSGTGSKKSTKSNGTSSGRSHRRTKK